MFRRILALAMIVIFPLALAGCMTESGYYSPGESAGAGALGGAATGAALGAIIGAATGAPATGAWIGAAAGGLVGGVGGYLYAENRNSEIASSQAAAQSYNYNPSQGNLVKIDRVSVNPSVAHPGQQVNLETNYTILTPDNNPASVNLVWEVRYGGQLMGQPYQTTVNNANGSFTDSVEYALPNGAASGSYTVTSRVNSNYGGDQRDAYFSIQ
ncbi:MAG: YMGG-like glycine zipper-containing protein [Desulfobaccales bacterium]